MKQSTLAMLVMAAALGTALGGCASHQQAEAKKSAAERAQAAIEVPDWALQPPQRTGMAYGVGSIEVLADPADAVRRATELGRIDLVSQLRVTVSGDFSSTTTETRGTGQLTQVQKNVRNHVRSQVNPVELEDAVLADSDLVNGFAYALVELDRAAASARFRRLIGEVESELDEFVTLMDRANVDNKAPLDALRSLLPALDLFARRDALASQLELVSQNHTSPALSSEHRALQQRIYQNLDKLRVVLHPLNDAAVAMSGDVLEALTEQGLNISDRDSSADLVMDLTTELSDKQQNGRVYVFANSRLTIRDASGRALSSFNQTAKGVSGLEDLARQKAASAVAEQLGNELAATLVDKLR